MRWVAAKSQLGEIYPGVAALPESLPEEFAIAVGADGKLVAATSDPAVLLQAFLVAFPILPM